MTSQIQDFLNCFTNLTETSTGWDASCPCPSHGHDGKDRRPSLRITIGEEGKILLKCRVGCSTESILYSIGKDWKDLFVDDETHLKSIIPATKVIDDEKLDLLNSYHQTLLDNMKLDPIHEEYLVDRGFDPFDIHELEYKTLDRQVILNNDIGISESQSSFYRGIVIPVRDFKGRVVALKLRRLSAEGPKYTYLPFQYGTPNLVHYPKGFMCIEDVMVTEGEFKADYLSSMNFISVPGVCGWKGLPDDFISLGFETVSIAFDWPDVKSKTGIREQVVKFGSECKDRGLNVLVATWESEHKGIDDLYSSGSGDLCKYIPFEEFLEMEMDSKLTALSTVEVKDREERIEDSVPAFPLDVFPNVLADYFEQVSESMNCPKDFPGVVSLASAGAAIGSSRGASLKHGWVEYPSVYSCVVAAPGEAKTPVQSHILSPMYDIQREVCASWDLRRDMLPPWEQKKMAPPQEFFTTNTTTEALVDRMSNNPRGLMIASDEILSWVNGMNQYRGGQGNDLQFFLSGWSGAMHKADRKSGSKPVTIIHKTPLTILGSIQPKLLVQLGEYAKREDGFLDRFVFTYPKERPVRLWTDVEISKEGIEIWRQCIRRLYHLPISEFRILSFAPECKEIWVEWHDRLEMKKANPIYPGYLRTYLPKVYCYCIRFALILEYLNWVVGPGEEPNISVDSLKSSIKLCDYFMEHYQRVRSFFNETKEQDMLLEFLRWLWNDKNKGKTTAKDLALGRKGGLPRSINEIRKVFLTAHAYQLGEYHSEKDGKRDVFLAHPGTHEMVIEGKLF